MSGVTKLIVLGTRFGKLVVTGPAPSRGKGALWNVHCECGTEKIVYGSKLRSGAVTSCGCAADRSAPAPDAPEGGAYLALGNSRFALVDLTDVATCRAFLWHLEPRGYAANWGAGTLHRFLMHPAKGEWVDHINGDRLDNRRANLRLVSPKQSAWNRATSHSKKYTAFKGVFFNKRDGMWTVCVAERRIGEYGSEEEAARVYDAVARRVSGGFAAINFPFSGERGTS